MSDDDRLTARLENERDGTFTREEATQLAALGHAMSIRLIGGTWRDGAFAVETASRPAADGIALCLVFEHGAVPFDPALCELTGRQLGIEIGKALTRNAAAVGSRRLT